MFKIATHSLKKDVSITPFKCRTLSDIGSEKRDAKKITHFFSTSFSSLADLINYVDMELKPNNVRLHVLTGYFYSAVLSNPHWLASVEDFDLLLANEYFWPQHYSDQAMDPNSF